MEGPQSVYPTANSVSGDTSFELNPHRLSCEKSCTKVEQRTCTNLKEHVENDAQQASNCCSVIKKDNVIDEKVGVVETFHFQNYNEQLVGHYPTSEEDKVSNSEEISACKEFSPWDARLKKCLSKSATFPSPEAESLQLFYAERNWSSSAERNGASPSTAAPVQNGDLFPTYKRSTSLPASSKPVSAMKGGREQHGTSPKIDMRVKWAVDVYDPPATSMSHTVKGYNIPRPKSKKKDNHNRHKHKKSKNSRGSSNGKKFPNRGNVGSLSVPFPAKLQADRTNGLAESDSRGKSAFEIMDFAVGGVQDVNCGSIFLWESLAKVHLSFGEAT